jgi:hypothetical protein
LQGRSAYTGTVCSFIPGQNAALAAVVELEHMIEVDAAVGQITVLDLRYSDAEWTEANVVQIELCDFIPEAKPWQSRRQGKWIESNAICSRVPVDDVTSR